MSLADSSEPINISQRVLAEVLTIDICTDSPTAIETVASHDLEKWGSTFDDVLSIGFENLKAASDDDFYAVAPGVYQSPWQDYYDASRMLLVGIFDRIPLKGRPVVMIPSNNCLMVTGDSDAAGLVTLALAGRDAFKNAAKRLSARAFRLNATWETFLPEAGHPAYQAFVDAAIDDRLSEYSGQQSLLQTALDRRGEDIFVATLMAKTDVATGKRRTIATWGDGLDTYLPVADEIAFSVMNDDNTGKRLGSTSWEKVVAIAGNLMVPEDMYPPRYRVTQFPTDDQLRTMGLTLE